MSRKNRPTTVIDKNKSVKDAIRDAENEDRPSKALIKAEPDPAQELKAFRNRFQLSQEEAEKAFPFRAHFICIMNIDFATLDVALAVIDLEIECNRIMDDYNLEREEALDFMNNPELLKDLQLTDGDEDLDEEDEDY